MMRRRVLLSLGALLLVATRAHPQGNLSAQGFGYPAGGLSTRAAATGGALGEFDYSSVRNPSSILGFGRGGMYFQYEPEFRSVRAAGNTDRTTTARFPLAMAALQTGPRAMVTFSSSTLLDRTWATRVRSGQILGSDSVGFEESIASTGAITDFRVAMGYAVNSGLSVGVGVHGYTGENRMQLARQFDDSLKYGTLIRQLTLGYSGTALSVGATWRPFRSFAFAASARQGGRMNLQIGDSLVSSAHVPNRYGAAVRFDGLPGASVSLSAERTEWTRMSSLSVTSLGVRDAMDVGAGVELLGPRLRSFPMLLYFGYRQRDLPFSTTGSDVKERMFTSGLGMPLAGPRVVFDLALQRASRGTHSGVSESAWLLSAGFTVRP